MIWVECSVFMFLDHSGKNRGFPRGELKPRPCNLEFSGGFEAWKRSFNEFPGTATTFGLAGVIMPI